MSHFPKHPRPPPEGPIFPVIRAILRRTYLPKWAIFGEKWIGQDPPGITRGNPGQSVIF